MKNNQGNIAGITKYLNEHLPKKRHEPGNKPILVIDGMNLAHAAYHSYSKLSYKGKSVSMIFGVPQMVKSYINRWKPEKAIICWDGNRHKERLAIHPEYKFGRKGKNQEFLDELKTLRKLFFYLGVPQTLDKELEGDDMIYHVVKKYSLLSPVRIYSADKDMWQLLNWDVTIDNPRNQDIFTPVLLAAGKGIMVPWAADYLCLIGDDSDNIKGYHGIGEVRAQKFLNEFGSIKAFIKNEKAEFNGITDKEKLRQIWKKNRLLIDLKFFNEKFHPNYEIKFYKDIQNPKFDEILFRQLAIKYNMKTMVQPQFIQTFKNL